MNIRRKRLIFIILLVTFCSSSLMQGCAKQPPTVLYQQGVKMKEEADEARGRNKFDLALEYYKRSLAIFKSIKKQYPNWKKEDINLDSLIKKCSEAVRSMEVKVQLQLAYSYLQTNRDIVALKICTDILNKYDDRVPETATAQWLIGYIYQKINRYEDALGAYNIVLDKYKDQVPIYILAQAGVGDIYLITERFTDAQNAYQKVLNHPDKDYPVVKAVELLLELVPIEEWEIIRYRYGKEGYFIIHKFLNLKLSETEFQESLSALRKGFENDALFFIGMRYHLKGEINKASKYYQRCIDILDKEEFVHNLAKDALGRID